MMKKNFEFDPQWVIFEDDFIVAFNKPSGLPTQASVDKSRDNLFDLANNSKRWKYLALHHRLDVPTSGIIIMAKKQEINKSITELFKDKNIKKTYLALCNSSPKDESFEIKDHLKTIKLPGGKSIVKAVKSGGDVAHTIFKLKKSFGNYSLIQAMPQTGRMHQIRVHLNSLNLPILGDALYFRADRKFPRLMLHAYNLEFTHPILKTQIQIHAPIPEDFQNIINKLEAKNVEQTSI